MNFMWEIFFASIRWGLLKSRGKSWKSSEIFVILTVFFLLGYYFNFNKTFRFLKNMDTGVYQLLFWINFWGCPGNLKITVTPLWPRFESYHGIFFPYTFFIHFIRFSSAVEMSSSIQSFSPIKLFFVIEIQCFLF